MDATIKLQFPSAVWTMKMATTAGDAIVARITIYFQTPNMWTANIVIDCCWPSFSDWESDVRNFLEPLVNENNAIVESRIKKPRYDATETERRIREIINQILGIPGL